MCHVAFHRQLGMKAAALGAVAGMFPDVDAFFGANQGPFAQLESHRGITHSLFFGPVVGSVFGWLYWRRLSQPAEPRNAGLPGPGLWMLLFSLALLSHPLLDLFTHYGTQLLAPFSRTRFAIPAVPILDPVYTLTLIGGLVLAAAIGRRERRGEPWRWSAGWATGITLLLSTAYLFLGLWVNTLAEAEVRRQLDAEGILAAEVYAYPTILQLPYRRVVALDKDQGQVRVGFVSVWRPCRIDWDVAALPADELHARLADTSEGRIFTWFAGQKLTGRLTRFDGGSMVELSDLRYGFVADASQGMWGIRGRFADDGSLLGEPEYFRNVPSIGAGNIGALMTSAFPSDCEKAEVPTFADFRSAD